MQKQNRLIFESGKPLPKLGNERYKLTRITILQGNGIDCFRLNIVSYIGEVRSDVPIIFSSLPDIAYGNADKRDARISVKLDFTDKREIELILTSLADETEYEVIIDYDVL